MTKTVQGTYGSGNTRCNIFVYETRRGNWYAVEGSQNVNCTSEDLETGVDVETLADHDYFNWKEPIWSEEDLEAAVDA